MVIKKTYRVRLEVRRNGVMGYVNGKRLGHAKLSSAYDWTTPRQPHLMTVVSRIAVSSYRIERYAPSKDDNQKEADAEKWQAVFGKDTTRQQVEAKAAEVVPLLDHDEWAVRQAAQNLLHNVGGFALPALHKAVEGDSLELRMRAEQLIKAIPSPMPETNQEPKEEATEPAKASE